MHSILPPFPTRGGSPAASPQSSRDNCGLAGSQMLLPKAGKRLQALLELLWDRFAFLCHLNSRFRARCCPKMVFFMSLLGYLIPPLTHAWYEAVFAAISASPRPQRAEICLDFWAGSDFSLIPFPNGRAWLGAAAQARSLAALAAAEEKLAALPLTTRVPLASLAQQRRAQAQGELQGGGEAPLPPARLGGNGSSAAAAPAGEGELGGSWERLCSRQVSAASLLPAPEPHVPAPSLTWKRCWHTEVMLRGLCKGREQQNEGEGL